MTDIKIKWLIDEDFQQYKKPSMFVAFPYCTFKCGRDVCQNFETYNTDIINISTQSIVDRYAENPITQAIVFGGFEPMDSMADMVDLIVHLRSKTKDDIIIYTGYNEGEERPKRFLRIISDHKIPNIIVKYGRYIPDDKPIFSDVLGVTLASGNQYAVRYNCERGL